MVQHFDGSRIGVDFKAFLDDFSQFFFTDQEVNLQSVRILFSVNKPQILRNVLVEDEPADCRFNDSAAVSFALCHPDPDSGVDPYQAFQIGHEHFIIIRKYPVNRISVLILSFAFLRVGVTLIRTRMGQIIGSQDHVLRRYIDRGTILWRQDIVDRQHQVSGLCLRFYGQWQMYRHLVSVKVRVIRRADQRMEFDRLAFHQYRFKRLDSQSVQGRGTVQQDRMLPDYIIQYIPYVRTDSFHHALGALDIMGLAMLHQTLHDEWLKQLQCHFFRESALIELQFRSDDDNRTSGIIDTLAQQVLSETSLLALEHVGKGLERPASRPCDRTAAPAIVDQRVDSLLQHPLFVPDNDIRRAQLQQSPETVVPVDDTSVKVVEIGSRETAAIQLDHRTQIRRDDRNDFQDHPFRFVAGGPERFDDFKSPDNLDPFLTGSGLQFFSEFRGHFFQVDLLQELTDCLRAHGCLELIPEL